MKKTKCKKILSLGIIVLLFCSLLYVPATANTNLFINPEFQVADNEVTGWLRNGSGDNYPNVTDNIITPEEEGYDENAPAEGNIFCGVAPGIGLKSDYIILDKEGKCYITVWYKSKLDSVMQIVVEEFAIDGTTRLKQTTLYCPNTVVGDTAEWVCYKTRFMEQADGERVRVTFRTNNFENNLSEKADVHFMSPYCTTEMPTNYFVNGDFENNSLEGWQMTSTDKDSGNATIETESNGNHYLKLEHTGETAHLRMSYKMPQTELLTYEAYYKISFKFMPISDGSTPYVEAYHLCEGGRESGTSTKIYEQPLGTPEVGKWTQYIYYIQLTGTRETYGNARRIEIRPRAAAGMIVAYDDFKIEPAANNAMLYQCGIEADSFVEGKTVTARYHNVSSADATFILARYTVDGDSMKLVEVRIASAPKEMTTVTEDSVLEITNPTSGDIIKTFAFSGLSPMAPEIEPSVATVVAASATN